MPVEAKLVFPEPDSQLVPQNAVLYVEHVTRVLVTSEDTGDALPASADFEHGPRWYLGDELEPGWYFVLAEPELGTDNYAGEGELVDLGRFRVMPGRDVSAAGAAFVSWATWYVEDGEETFTVALGAMLDEGEQPLRYQVDVGDATIAPDGVPDAETRWTESLLEGDTALLGPSLDRRSAVVAARTVDLYGHVGEWSEPMPFEVLGHATAGCTQATGAPVGLAPAVLLVAAVTAARRSARRPLRRTPRSDGRPVTR